MTRWTLKSSLLALLALSLPAASVGCKNTPSIPGTEIPDTEENREILQVLERFRTAMVRQDTAAIVATADSTYYDEGGTDDPGDDVVYEELAPLLVRRLAQVDSVRFTMEYLDIFIRNERATVHVWIDASFHMRPILREDGTPRLQPRFARKQDYAKFELIRDGDSWRITKGI
ncbi:MAG: hypothetical protein IPK80_23580 [Nannocystis sp.]|jgi:hypothetical protein|nr:hypothetical protein [Nannocystis sp.]